MYKKISVYAAKGLMATMLLEQTSSALTLNGKTVSFDKSTIPELKALGVATVSKTVLVRFSDPLNSKEKEKFYQMGVDTIVYAGDLSYYFYMPESLVQKIAQRKDIKGISDVQPEFRVSSDSDEHINLITMSENSKIFVNVLFLKEFDEDALKSYLERNNIHADLKKVTPELRSAKMMVDPSDYEKLSYLPLVQYMDKVQKVLHTDSYDLSLKSSRNSKTSEYLHVDALWKAPYNLHGENMKVGIVDGGLALPNHVEFQGGRIHDKTSDGEVNFHSTHVAGTIGAAGINPKAKGMASAVELYSYSFSDNAFSDAVLNMYKKDGILFSNHSYGYSQKERLAEYDSVAATQDLTVSKNPFINIFEAAGNDGEDSSYPDYGIIKGPGNSKNIFTIGALNSPSDDVAGLSSAGPVKDGRIKPDLCTRGEFVTSATSDSPDSYAMMSGTSMATPAATGAAILVAQDYKRLTNDADIRHDILKSVLINTAEDIGNPGPDYKAGFGMINAKAAVDTVNTLSTHNPLIHIDSIGYQKVAEYSFTTVQAGDFKTTLVWVDPQANPSTNETLVNDLDMVLESVQTGKKYYPYTLDKNHPSRNAVQTKANHVDNIEQIEIKNLPAGKYKLSIAGTRIITDKQDYALTSSMTIFQNSNIEILRPSNIHNFARTIMMNIY